MPLTGIFLAGLKDSNAASPALVVQGLGHLSVPITPEQSSQLQALCSPDPSRLEGAAGDPEKHPAWQLSPSLFQCSNPGQTSEELDEVLSAFDCCRQDTTSSGAWLSVLP